MSAGAPPGDPRSAPVVDRAAVHAAVDRVLLAHGAYLPLELLLDLDRLDYADYEAWRTGELEALEDALLGNPERIRAVLEEAARWAGRLGLRAQAEVHVGWGPVAGERLVVARDAGLARLLAARHARPEPQAQRDLFLDGSESAALAELREALVARDAPRAASRLEALFRTAPDHRLREAAEHLCDALADLAGGEAIADPGDELEALRGRLAEHARTLLGARARDFLAPFWRRLAQRLDGQPFDPARPERHASFALAQCLAWREAGESVRATPGFESEPVLLARLAEAERRAGERVRAIDTLARLSWVFPREAEDWLDAEGFPDPGVRAAWEALRDLDLEPALDARWLPAWLLVVEPGLARVLEAAPPAVTGAAGEAFGALRALHAAAAPDSTAPAAMAERARLRAAHPGLLACWLARREPK